MNTLKIVVKFIIKFKYLIMLFLAILLSFSAYQTIKNLKIDNSLTIWFLDDNPDYKAYIDYQEKFGSDEIYIAMLPVENALSKSVLKNLKALTTEIESLSYVKTSFSLAKATYPNIINNNIKFERIYNGTRSAKSAKSILSKMPNIASQLVSKDYKNVFFYIQLNPTPSIENKRGIILEEIKTTIYKHCKTYHLTGPPVLNEAYSNGIYKESLLFGLLTVIIITVLLLFLLPSTNYLLIALSSVGIPVGLLFGIITANGYALNMISMLIPTILMVYCVSDVVHIINIYHKEYLNNLNLSKVDLIAAAVAKSIIPCFYTTLTTFVGYFALYLSPLPAFKNMGIFTCLGLFFSFVIVYLISILGFSLITVNPYKKKAIFSIKISNQKKVIDSLNNYTTVYKWPIISFFTFLLLIGCYAVSKVDIDTRSFDLLAEGTAKNDLRIIEKELKGSSRLQLNITTKNNNAIVSKTALQNLEKFQKKLAQNPLITAPVSVVNIKHFLQKRNPYLFVKEVASEKIKQTLENIEDANNSFFKLFSKDLRTAVYTLSLREMTTSELNEVIANVKEDFENSFDSDEYELKINGFAVVFAQLNQFILSTQFKSFFVAFFVAFLCLLFFVKNIRTTIIILIPNILPLAVLAIIMVVLDIPLDVTTAMITPIMLGIAMDDTIHLIYNYQKQNKADSSETNINKALTYTGSALFSTTIALVGGFLIIALSATPSVSGFGILCAVTVAIALITDIIFLPALLKVFDK